MVNVLFGVWYLSLLYTLYSTIQSNPIQYNTIQYSTLHYTTIQYNPVQYNTMQKALFNEWYDIYYRRIRFVV